jgi:hypothetical protein
MKTPSSPLDFIGLFWALDMPVTPKPVEALKLPLLIN